MVPKVQPFGTHGCQIAETEAPAELVQALSAITARIDALSAPALAAAASAAPDTVEALRAELATLENHHGPAPARRRGEIFATIRQIQAGTYNAAGPRRAAQLSAELATLVALNDKESNVRKANICAELRELRAASPV